MSLCSARRATPGRTAPTGSRGSRSCSSARLPSRRTRSRPSVAPCRPHRRRRDPERERCRRRGRSGASPSTSRPAPTWLASRHTSGTRGCRWATAITRCWQWSVDAARAVLVELWRISAACGWPGRRRRRCAPPTPCRDALVPRAHAELRAAPARGRATGTALIGVAEDDTRTELTFDALRAQVGCAGRPSARSAGVVQRRSRRRDAPERRRGSRRHAGHRLARRRLVGLRPRVRAWSDHLPLPAARSQGRHRRSRLPPRRQGS